MSLAVDFGLDLITLAEAVDQIWREAGSRYQARVLVADAIHNGDVVVYASRVFDIENATPTLEFDELFRLGKLYHEAGEVDPGNWRNSCLWPDEVRFWDWGKGNIILNLSEDLPDSFWGFAFEAVEVERRAVQAIVGKSDRTGVGGRRPNRDRWDDFWIAFIDRLARDGKNLGDFDNRHDLLVYMQGASDDFFSDTNVKKTVDKVWTRLVEPRSQLSD